jgi:hypothetical protein
MRRSSIGTASRARVSAIVVSYNSARDIAACLASLQASSPGPDQIIVVDNHSQDGTPDMVRSRFPDVVVLDYWDNPGFAEGNNRAFRVATGDYYFLLNPDASVTVDALPRLVQALEDRPDAAVAIPKVLLAREPNIINSSGLSMNELGWAWDRGYLEWDRGQYDRGGLLIAGSGCAMLLRSSLVADVGEFDSKYFLYYEDLDFCLRARLRGYGVLYVPEAVVKHSMKVSGRPLLYDEYLDHRNRLRTTLKVWSAGRLARVLPRAVALDVMSIVGLAMAGRFHAATLRLQAWVWNVVHLRSTRHQRSLIQRRRRIPDRLLEELMVGGDGAPRLNAALPGYPEMYDDSAISAPLDRRLTMGQNDVGLLGLGWYDLETDGGMTYRWSCGYGIVFLRQTVPSGRSAVVIVCRSPIASTIAVCFNRRSHAEFTVPADSWTECSLTVDLDSELVRLELFPQKVFVPAETMPGSRDRRVLGLAVSRIELR